MIRNTKLVRGRRRMRLWTELLGEGDEGGMGEYGRDDDDLVERSQMANALSTVEGPRSGGQFDLKSVLVQIRDFLLSMNIIQTNTTFCTSDTYVVTEWSIVLWDTSRSNGSARRYWLFGCISTSGPRLKKEWCGH